MTIGHYDQPEDGGAGRIRNRYPCKGCSVKETQIPHLLKAVSQKGTLKASLSGGLALAFVQICS